MSRPRLTAASAVSASVLFVAVMLPGCSAAPTPARAASRAPGPATPSPPPAATYSVADEGWMLTRPAQREIEGYVSPGSVNAGQGVDLYVSTTESTYSAAVYRMGWYGGGGAQLMAMHTNLRGEKQSDPSPPNPDSGLVTQDWHPSVRLPTQPGWPSGMYMIKLTTAAGLQSLVPFVVRGRGESRLVLIHSSATDQAYNTWGGESLYMGRTPKLNLPRAIEVSFDRPYQQDFGAGQFFFWEYPMVRFLERSGYSVDYLTDIDVHEHPDYLLRYRGILIVGHDEYWTRAMRDAYANAIARGVNLAVFGGNTAYRQFRFLHSRNGPDRLQVCYKVAGLDPMSGRDDGVVTAESWRDPPTRWFEQQLLGGMYVATGNFGHLPWVASDTSHWVFEGTGLKPGDSLPGLVGYEEDRFFARLPHPDAITVLSYSPIRTTIGTWEAANSTIYHAPSGADVFNAGTIEWSWGLDDFVTPTRDRGLRRGVVEDDRPNFRNAAAERITSNILNRFQQ
jgi:hypothetical protein